MPGSARISPAAGGTTARGCTLGGGVDPPVCVCRSAPLWCEPRVGRPPGALARPCQPAGAPAKGRKSYFAIQRSPRAPQASRHMGDWPWQGAGAAQPVAQPVVQPTAKAVSEAEALETQLVAEKAAAEEEQREAEVATRVAEVQAAMHETGGEVPTMLLRTMSEVGVADIAATLRDCPALLFSSGCREKPPPWRANLL